MKLDSILRLLRFLGAMSGGLLALSCIGLVLSDKSTETVVVYTLSCAVNAFVFAGALIAPKRLLLRQAKRDGGMQGKETGDLFCKDAKTE